MSIGSIPLVLRNAVAEDCRSVRALEEELFGADAWSAATVADALAGDTRQAVVAVAGGEVVGYAVLRVAGEVADLERVAVAPTHRRAGLASALLRAGSARARQEGAERVLLEVSEANEGARAFYAAHGAVALDRRGDYYRDGSDALVLQLPLDPSPARHEGRDRG